MADFVSKFYTITNIFFLTMISLKLLVLIVRIFVGNPKICLSSSFANTCVPPETPQKGILFLGHPVHGSGIIPTPIPVSVSVSV